MREMCYNLEKDHSDREVCVFYGVLNDKTRKGVLNDKTRKYLEIVGYEKMFPTRSEANSV